jgi:hypothetical protein
MTMTAHQPLFLYYGDETAAAALSVALGAHAHVMAAGRIMEALGMYITYLPDAVMIDACAPGAAEVLTHLKSVEAVGLVLLTDDRRAALGRSATMLPTHLNAAELATALTAIVRGESPLWALHADAGLQLAGGAQARALKSSAQAERRRP